MQDPSPTTSAPGQQPPRRPRAAINVDIDGLYLYDRIHGHAGASGNTADFSAASHDATVWTKGVTRFLDLFARTGIQATFFVVAQDLENPEVQAVLRDLVAAGHEIGSHSLTHPYDLSRRPAAEIVNELTSARAKLQDATGQAVTGFRAPGYVLSTPLRLAIADAGHAWDSSRFPCPAYQAAKLSAITLYHLLGRPSGSVAETPDIWLGPRTPYVDRLPDGRALLEMPIGVIPRIRWPLIGTSLIMAGLPGWLALRPLTRTMDWFNFELHGIDLTDHEADGIPDRLKTQPDQWIALRRKWPLLVRVCEDLRQSHDIRTLGQWAESEI